MNKKNKLITFIRKISAPSFLAVLYFLNVGENPKLSQKIAFVILMPILFWLPWVKDGTQLLPWYKGVKKKK